MPLFSTVDVIQNVANVILLQHCSTYYLCTIDILSFQLAIVRVRNDMILDEELSVCVSGVLISGGTCNDFVFESCIRRRLIVLWFMQLQINIGSLLSSSMFHLNRGDTSNRITINSGQS